MDHLVLLTSGDEINYLNVVDLKSSEDVLQYLHQQVQSGELELGDNLESIRIFTVSDWMTVPYSEIRQLVEERYQASEDLRNQKMLKSIQKTAESLGYELKRVNHGQE